MIASTMNTVAKEVIAPNKVMTLPFIDVDITGVVIHIRTEKEARELLSNIRGF